MSDLVGRLAEKWLEEQGDDIEPTYDRNRTDSKAATEWWLNEIADELEKPSPIITSVGTARFRECADWLRSKAAKHGA